MAHDPAGLYFGTRTGEVYASDRRRRLLAPPRRAPAAGAVGARRADRLIAPMEVRVRVPTQLRDLVGGAATSPSTCRRAGEAWRRSATCSTSWPPCIRRWSDASATSGPRAGRHVNLFVGADNVRDRDGLDTPIPPGRSCRSSPPSPAAERHRPSRRRLASVVLLQRQRQDDPQDEHRHDHGRHQPPRGRRAEHVPSHRPHRRHERDARATPGRPSPGGCSTGAGPTGPCARRGGGGTSARAGTPRRTSSWSGPARTTAGPSRRAPRSAGRTARSAGTPAAPGRPAGRPAAPAAGRSSAGAAPPGRGRRRARRCPCRSRVSGSSSLTSDVVRLGVPRLVQLHLAAARHDERRRQAEAVVADRPA